MPSVRGVRLFVSLVVVVSVLSSASGAAAGSCDFRRQVTDRKGDATGFFYAGATSNQPSLDILTGRLNYRNKAMAVEFAIDVSDLQRQAPDRSLGKYFAFEFAFLGVTFGMNALQHDLPGSEVYWLEAEGETLSNDFAGSFDSKKDEVVMSMPLKTFNRAFRGWLTSQGFETPPPAMKFNSKLTNLRVASFRWLGPDVGAVTPIADDAPSRCSYSVGRP